MLMLCKTSCARSVTPFWTHAPYMLLSVRQAASGRSDTMPSVTFWRSGATVLGFALKRSALGTWRPQDGGLGRRRPADYPIGLAITGFQRMETLAQAKPGEWQPGRGIRFNERTRLNTRPGPEGG